MKRLHQSQDSRQGFSLVEILIVITVIGIIGALAIPGMVKASDAAKHATSQRNAQQVVSMYEAGVAAGIVWQGASRNEKIAAVVAGDKPAAGSLTGMVFRVPNLTGDNLINTYPFIGYDNNGDLFYDEAGTRSST